MDSVGSPKRTRHAGEIYASNLASPSPDKRIRIGGLFSEAGGKRLLQAESAPQYQCSQSAPSLCTSCTTLNVPGNASPDPVRTGGEEDFNIFVEHALSPLSGIYGHDSPSVAFSQRFQEPPLSTGGVSIPVPTSNDWSPSVTGGYMSVAARSDFKVCFDDVISSSLGSPGAHPPRMRHKKIHCEINEMNSLDATATHEHFNNNKQALASRMKDSYLSSSGGGMGGGLKVVDENPDYERMGIGMGIAEHYDERYDDKGGSSFNSWTGASPLTIDVDDHSGSRPRRSGRSKTPTSVASDGATDGAFSGGRQRSPRSAMSVASSGGGASGGSERWGTMRRTTSSIELLRSTESQEFYTSSMGPVIRCNCKKSRCLKLYCECLHALKFCENCNCYDCENTAANVVNRDDIIEQIRERNPEAFA